MVMVAVVGDYVVLDSDIDFRLYYIKGSRS